MSDHVYGIVELVGTSKSGCDDAIHQAVAAASKLYSHIDWFEVIETRGHVSNGNIEHFQVKMKIGYRLENVGG